MASINHQNLQQVAPGLLFSSTHRFQELKKCLFSDCDAWTLKAEKILIHGSFLFGYVSPSRFVWDALKHLLTRTSNQLGNALNNPYVESQVRMGMSLMEQLGLTYIWDFVRDGSICMRFNNCDNDFLAQLSNFKIKTCNVDNLMDDTRKLSVCEQVFNDSPLILLAGGMVLLAIFASSNTNAPTPATPGNNGNQSGDGSSNANGPGGGVTNDRSNNAGGSSNSSSGAANVVGHSVTGSIKTGSSSGNSSGQVSVNSGITRSIPANSPIAFSSFNVRVQPPNAGNSPPTQPIQAQCPNCCKNFTCTVPQPWPISCSKIFPHTESKREEYVIEKVLKELSKDIKCEVCKETIKKKLQEYQKKRKQGQQPTKNPK